MSEEPFSDEEWDAYFDGVAKTEDEQYEQLKWGWNPGPARPRSGRLEGRATDYQVTPSISPRRGGER